MIERKKSRMRLRGVVFGFFFAMLSVFGLLGPTLMPTGVAYADPVESNTSTTENNDNSSNNSNSGNSSNDGNNNDANAAEAQTVSTGDGCQASLGAIGWLVCPTTGAIAGAVDYLYGLIQDLLAINPVEMKDGTPIYEIWKYCRGFANIVFIIFLLVVIYSQITGLGITNYGIKKALPKLIVVAILVNLSFLICSLMVDVSNIIGNSLRGLFDSVEQAAMAGMAANGGATATQMQVTNAEMFSSIAGGTALAIGGAVIAFETGAIWMLIPVVLGAIIAVVTGLITIALRQAVVALLIMISPLAVVAYMLPNTENLFTKWKKLLTQMLVFYPMFSLLFGASSLAGFAIIASASDGFGLLLGVAVQIFPLFFAWKLMQMSGTFLGDINTKLRAIGTRPASGARAWADSRRMAAKQKHLASGRATTPSLRLMQFATNRRIAREADMADNAELVKNRALAYRASLKYDKNGVPTRRAEEAYENQAKSMEYQRIIERDKNNMNKGLAYLAAEGTAKKVRLEELDAKNVKASDYLKAEQARGEHIEYENAVGFHQRMENAVNAHFDSMHANDPINPETGRTKYRQHEMMGMDTRESAMARYNAINQIMEGDAKNVQLVAANAATAYDTQKKILETKYQKYFEMTPPTKDVEFRLGELTKMPNAANYIDAILPGLRILNQRGDTDVVRKQMENILNSEQGVQLGTHASQALASFLMFEVKGGDPFLRRYGKYINLETAKVYNKSERLNTRLSLDEFVTGEYDEYEDYPDPNNPSVMKRRLVKKPVKKPMTDLIEGTSLDQVERTAFSNLDEMLVNAYTDENGLNIKKYLAKRKEMEEAMVPAFIAASLKYDARSEQLKSAVSFLTGYDGKGKGRWEAGGDLAGDAKYAEEYFRARTMKYLADQTPMQILALRSDYRDAMVDHLVEEYLEKNPSEREKYNNEMAQIQASYGDEDVDTATKKRNEDTAKLKMDLAGRQMRRIMGETGKLTQLYKSRSSGAANNAKDWVRELLSLDNEDALRKEVVYYKQKQKEEYEEEMKKRREADPNFESTVPTRIYDEADQENFKAVMRDIRDRFGDGTTDAFFEKTRDQLGEWFSKDDYIVWSYEKYYKDYKDTTDNEDLYDWIREVLSDLNQYPGNRDLR